MLRYRRLTFITGCLILIFGLTHPAFAQDCTPAQINRVPVTNPGVPENNYLGEPVLSADGRYVAFTASVNRLVPDTTNTASHVFVYDWQTGETTWVSAALNDPQAHNNAYSPAISANGRFVAFVVTDVHTFLTEIYNMSPQNNDPTDIIIYDQQTGETQRVFVPGDSRPNHLSYNAAFSADGQMLVFASYVNHPVTGTTDGRWDVFNYQQDTGEIVPVPIGWDGSPANGASDNPAISAGGRFVAFTSEATNLVVNDTNQYQDVFVYDRQTGKTTRISVASDGTQANHKSYKPALSADGRYVAFASGASNLVPNDTNDVCEYRYTGGEVANCIDIFVHDRQTATTTRVSVASDGAEANNTSYGPQISADGRLIAFTSQASNLVDDKSGFFGSDVFVHNQQTGETIRIRYASDGTLANSSAYAPALSPDGQLLAFVSDASNLVPEDTNQAEDIFIAPLAACWNQPY